MEKEVFEFGRLGSAGWRRGADGRLRGRAVSREASGLVLTRVRRDGLAACLLALLWEVAGGPEGFPPFVS